MKINWKSNGRYGKNKAYAWMEGHKYCVGINGTSIHKSFTNEKDALEYLNKIKN